MLRATNLSYTTPDGRCLLAPLSFELTGNRVLGVVGNNGAGKTTLLRLLAGILTPDNGVIEFRGSNVQTWMASERADKLAYRPQQMSAAWNLPVCDVVALSLGAPKRASDVRQALTDCDLEQFAERRIWELSGGEQARVYFARLLASSASLILADEPFAGIDLKYQLRLVRQLRRWLTPERSVIIAIHDIGLALRLCTDFLILQQGRLLGHVSAKDPNLLACIGQALDLDLQRQHDGTKSGLFIDERV